MKSKYFILTFFISCCLLNKEVNAQNSNDSVLLSGHFTDKGFKVLEIVKCGIRSHLNFDPDFEIAVDNKRKFKQLLDIKAPSYYRIGDLYVGHTIFLEPKDTVVITLNPDQDLAAHTGKYYNITVKSKYPGNIIFFDELDKIIGVTVKYKFENPLVFKEICKTAFNKSIKLLNDFKDRNTISENFYKYTLEDLKARQILWFCEMLGLKNKINFKSSLIDEFKVNTFSDSTFSVASDKYAIASFVYNYYIANNFNPENFFSNLTNEFTTILKNYTGLVRDRLMGWEIEDYLGKDNPSFDSCYQVFLLECNNNQIRNEVVNKVDAYVKPIHNLNKISLLDLLNISKLKDAADKKISLFSVIDDSAINLIDCWATWCIPCRNQIPYVDQLRKKYGSKMNIVYISFDKDEIKWKSFVKKNNLKNNQIIIDNDFGSEFSKYFDIQTIPRYILISKGGLKVLNGKMPLPALQEDFEAELKKYLNY
jgi:thiol-disulfide isomerase/thioredoxin